MPSIKAVVHITIPNSSRAEVIQILSKLYADNFPNEVDFEIVEIHEETPHT